MTERVELLQAKGERDYSLVQTGRRSSTRSAMRSCTASPTRRRRDSGATCGRIPRSRSGSSGYVSANAWRSTCPGRSCGEGSRSGSSTSTSTAGCSTSEHRRSCGGASVNGGSRRRFNTPASAAHPRSRSRLFVHGVEHWRDREHGRAWTTRNSCVGERRGAQLPAEAVRAGGGLPGFVLSTTESSSTAGATRSTLAPS